jgi:Uma2 family endonuclease
VRTVVLGPRPPELEALLERRHELGQDLHDEVWEGEYHMAPAPHPSHGLLDDEVAAVLRPLARRAGLVGSGPFNLGSPDDYRVPDRGLHRGEPTTTFVPTAAVVVEIASPDDETWNKVDFYAAHLVDELLIVDPRKRSVTWLVLGTDGYTEQDSSELLGVSSTDVTEQIDWPATT